MQVADFFMDECKRICTGHDFAVAVLTDKVEDFIKNNIDDLHKKAVEKFPSLSSEALKIASEKSLQISCNAMKG